MAQQDAPSNAQDPIVQGMTDLSRRLRVLEERYTVLRRKGQLAEENFIRDMKDLRESVAVVEEEATALRRLLVEIDDKLDRFLEQAKSAAPREDLLVLRKYIELWDPVQYVTREEARRLIAQARRKV